MARTLRNLQVALGVVFSDRGLGAFEKRMRRIDKRLTKVDKVARAGAGLTALAGAATSAGAALAPAAGAALALPGALGAAQAAAVTLKVATIGMGDAMSAVAEGDAAKLEEALVKLSPQARKFVREAAGLKDQFEPIREAVQDRVFDGLARDMRPVADNLLPDIKTGMIEVAGGFNAGTKEALRFAATPVAKGAVGKVFSSTSRVMGKLADATRPALQVITQLTVKSLPLAERMASWAVNGTKAAAAFLTSERGAAKLERTVDKAGDTLEQLGKIGGNTIRGVVNVFSRAKTSGDGLLDTVEDLTARFERWSRSTQGQQEAAETFRLLRDMASSVVDVLPLVLGPLGAVVKLINALPGPLRDGVLQFLAFAVVIGSVTGRLRPLLTMVGGLASAVRSTDGPLQRLRDNLSNAGGVAGKARNALSGAVSVLGGPWGLAVAAGALALGLFATRNDEAEAQVKELTDALVRNKGALDDNGVASVKNALETAGAYKAAQELGIALSDVTDAALGNAPALERVNTALGKTATNVQVYGGRAGQGAVATKQLTGSADLLSNALKGQNSRLEEARSRYGRLNAATPRTVTGAKDVANGMTDVGSSADRAAGRVAALTTKLSAFKNLTADADTAALNFRDGIDDLTAAFKRNGAGLDSRTGKFNRNTKVGRDNQRAVIDLIRSAVDHSDKLIKEGKSADVANRAFQRHIDKLRNVLRHADLSEREIDRLVRRYVTMPGEINKATGKIKNRTVRIEVKAGGELIGYKVQGGTLLKADGGILPGYTPGKDVHMFYSPTGGALGLSGGEAVMRPEWTKVVGKGAVDRVNTAARRGGVPAVKRLLASGVGPHNLGGEGAFFADGGIIAKNSVTGLSSVQRMAARANKLYGLWAKNIGTGISKAFSKMLVGGPGVRNALKWARSQNGKPYIWGGVGPRGYDCSGFMSAITNVIKGRRPYSRLFTTHSFGSRGGPGGFVRNRNSGFRVGVTDAGVGHMAGTLGGVNVESRGSRGVVVGSGARGANNGLFSRRYGLAKFDEGGIWPPGTFGFNGLKTPEYVFTQRQMQEGAGRGGDVHIHATINVPTSYHKGAVARELHEMLYEYQDRSGARLKK